MENSGDIMENSENSGDIMQFLSCFIKRYCVPRISLTCIFAVEATMLAIAIINIESLTT